MSLSHAGRFGGLKQRFKRGRMSTYHGFFDPWTGKDVDCRSESVARLWLLRRVDLATCEVAVWPPPWTYRGPLGRESLQCHLRTSRCDGSILYEMLEPRTASDRAVLTTRLAEAARQNGCLGRMVTAEELHSLDARIRNAAWMRQLLTVWFDHDLGAVESLVLEALKQGPLPRGNLSARSTALSDADPQRVDAAIMRLRGRSLLRLSLDRPYGDETVLHPQAVAPALIGPLQATHSVKESLTDAGHAPEGLVS